MGQLPLEGDAAVLAIALESPGRYTMGHVHGQGGQSRIFIAEDAIIGRQVAFKELLPHDPKATGSMSPAEATTRFLREAQVTGRLEHPNIVPVYEIGRRIDGSLYYTMRLVGGTTLGERIQGCKSYNDRRKMLSHVADLCHAIAYAHSRGIIHRDIKPANVMVGEFGETVVLDWGLAKARDQADVPGAGGSRPVAPGETMDGTIMGTPAYMSPEQASGEIELIDHQSDVWGLGAVLYEVLTGRPPIEGEDAMQMVMKLMADPQIVPVGTVCSEAPPELAAIAHRALQTDKSKRYASARDMALEIESFQSGQRVAAYDYSIWDLIRRFVTRYRVPVSMGLVGAVLLAVVGLWAVVRIENERDQAVAARHQAEDFAEQMIFNLADELSTLSGADEVRQRLVSSAIDYYATRIDVHRGDPQKRLQLASAFMRIAGVADEVGQTKQASWARGQAQDILAELHMTMPALPERHVAVVPQPTATVAVKASVPSAGASASPLALGSPGVPQARDPGAPLILYVWPSGVPPGAYPTAAASSAGPPVPRDSRELKAYTDYRSLLSMQEKLARDSRTPQSRLDLASTYLKAAQMELDQQDVGTAEEHAKLALSLADPLAHGVRPDRSAMQYDVRAYQLLANILSAEGNVGEAARYVDLGLAAATTLVRQNPDDLRSQLDHARMLSMAGRNDEAYATLAPMFSAHGRDVEVARRLTLAALASGHTDVVQQAARVWMEGSDSLQDRVLQFVCLASAAYLEGRVPDAISSLKMAQEAALSLERGYTTSFNGLVTSMNARGTTDRPLVAQLFADLEASRTSGDQAPQRIREALNTCMAHLASH